MGRLFMIIWGIRGSWERGVSTHSILTDFIIRGIIVQKNKENVFLLVLGEICMPVALAHKYPACFPPNFETDILPQSIPEITLFVYRICTNGIINKESFLSTYEEVVSNRRPVPLNWGDILNNPSTYSTSCDTELKPIKNILKCLKRYYPKPIIAEGTATFEYGPLQCTRERTGEKTTHVDWWIFADGDPSSCFQNHGENV